MSSNARTECRQGSELIPPDYKIGTASYPLADGLSSAIGAAACVEYGRSTASASSGKRSATVKFKGCTLS